MDSELYADAMFPEPPPPDDLTMSDNPSRAGSDDNRSDESHSQISTPPSPQTKEVATPTPRDESDRSTPVVIANATTLSWPLVSLAANAFFLAAAIAAGVLHAPSPENGGLRNAAAPLLLLAISLTPAYVIAFCVGVIIALSLSPLLSSSLRWARSPSPGTKVWLKLHEPLAYLARATPLSCARKDALR
eukprot:190438-Pleurochrysis_carterae.AAC.2